MHKTAAEDVETLSDTVRRFEVENDRAGVERLAGTTGSKTDPTRR